MLEIKYLNLDVTTLCNLQCFGCAHGMPYTGDPDYQSVQAITNFFEYIKKAPFPIRVNEFRLLGGEPLLVKNIDEFANEAIKYIDLIDRLSLTTNGTLNSDAIMNKLEPFKEHLNIVVTIHSKEPALFKKTMQTIIKFKQRGFNVKEWDATGYWGLDLHYTKDSIKPDNSDSLVAWGNCRKTRERRQLNLNSVSFCPITDNLHRTLKKTGQLDDPEWKKYLEMEQEYKIDFTKCTYQEFVEFMVGGPRDFCSMCIHDHPNIENKPVLFKDWVNIA